MTKKKMISILLVIVSLLSFCSFSTYADDSTLLLSDMGATMSREVTEGSSTVTYNYQFTDGTVTRGGILMHWYTANDPAFYASGGTKLTTVYGYNGLSAGHEYEMTFHTSINYNGRYTIQVFVDSNKLFESDFSGDSNKKINVKFTAPEAITDSTRIMIRYLVGSNYGYGASGQNVRYFISENLQFSDLTENPSWLGKILNKFSEIGQSISNLGTTIGNFFTNLGESIGGFFKDLWANIKQKFDDLKTWIDGLGENIKQWFIDLGNDISEFFTMLKNYLLYFQHPVTVNADGVLIGKDGKPVYTNPFDSAIDKVKETVDYWLSKINDFVDGMEQSRLDVTGYLESGTGVINKVLKASPILTACVVFAVGFLVIRKVVGR